MLRLLLALGASVLVGLLTSAGRLVWTDTSLRSPVAAGLVAVSLAIALGCGLFIYAPATLLLRKRGVTQRYLGAAAIGLAANLPLFIALLILDRVSDIFGTGEALTIAAMATAIGATHGFFAIRARRPRGSDDGVALSSEALSSDAGEAT